LLYGSISIVLGGGMYEVKVRRIKNKT